MPQNTDPCTGVSALAHACMLTMEAPQPLPSTLAEAAYVIDQVTRV